MALALTPSQRRQRRNAWQRAHRLGQAGLCIDCDTALSNPRARRCRPCNHKNNQGRTREVVGQLYRQFPDAPVKDVAAALGVSPQRVRQIRRGEGLL